MGTWNAYDFEEYVGKSFNDLTVIKFVGVNKLNRAQVLVKCICGVEKVLTFTPIKTGRTKSCGCRLNKKKKYSCLLGVTKKTCGIYKIESPDGLVYIGQSRSMLKRWEKYFCINQKRSINKIGLSMLKHGAENHVFSLIHELPPDVSLEVMDSYEQFYMDVYIDCAVDLLNLKEAGGKGKFKEEVIKKLKGENTWMAGRKIPKEIVKKWVETRKINKNLK